jgi:CDP-glycerol glycerophosphotransferase (TagB/SpsB family)
MILQIWHASGAYKRFGYQDLSSREGHTREFLHDYQIHRNYSWIICSGVGCQSVYAEAFGYPVDRVLPTGRPIEERLRNSSSKNNRRDRLSAGASRVVIAPTIRHSEESPHPLRNAYETFRSRPHDALWDGIDVCWAFHPLEAHCDVEQAGSGMLRNVDAVVTDYSSIVYDAYLLHVPVIFYVSDIVSYREAPGLNRDPLTVAPRLCCKTPVELKQLLTAVLADPSTYPWDQLERFVGDVFDGSSTHPAQTIASRAIAYIRED